MLLKNKWGVSNICNKKWGAGRGVGDLPQRFWKLVNPARNFRPSYGSEEAKVTRTHRKH